MLRQDEQTSDKPDLAADAAMHDLARRKAGARRTAWIVGAVAAAFFIASLLQGYFVHIPG